MKKFLFVFTISLFLSGCLSVQNPELYTAHPYSDFTILGPVWYVGVEKYTFGIHNGGTTYIGLLHAAQSKYPDCDYVIDVTIDKIRDTYFFFPFIVRIEHQMRGIAIRYNRPADPAVTPILKPDPPPIN